MRLASFVFAILNGRKMMARTSEAIKKAEQEGQQKRVDRGEGLNDGRPWTNDRRLILEEYYGIKHNILNLNSGQRIKTILFSSSNKGEGNSTVLIQFSLTLASEGERVLLVDANLRDPSFHKIFNLERENGLTELILGRSTLDEVIKKTRFNNLFVITSGILSRGPSLDRGPLTVDYGLFNPSALFESDSLDSHIENMKKQADWVLFDSPPINSFNDSIALAHRVDGVVMVVEAEKTRWEVAQSAKQRVESGNGKILGIVLNKRRYYIPEFIYKRL